MNNIDEEIAFVKNSLIADVRSMAARLIIEAERIQNDKYPNELGIIGVQGSVIDARCGALAAMMRLKEHNG